MNKKRQHFFSMKSIDNEAKTVTALVSDFKWDRTGERFAKGAWRLDAYMKNPIVLWAHQQDQLPLAKATMIQENEFGLLAEMQFDSENPFAMQVFSALERGFLNTFSVGFIPKNYVVEPIDGEQRGYVFTDAELLEFSVVPVPANGGALIQREDQAMLAKLLPGYIIEEVAEVEEEGKTLAEPVYRFKSFELPAQEKLPDPVKEEKAEPAPDTFAVALKSLNDVARTRTGVKMDEAGISLVKSTLSILAEIVNESEEKVDPEEVAKLKTIVDDLANFIKTNKPDYSDMISKILMQVDNAIRKGGRRK